MSMTGSSKRIQQFLDHADVRIGGSRPWDVHINDDRVFNRVLAHGSLGLGEAYMDGWWDCPRIDEFFHRVLTAGLDRQIHAWSALFGVLAARLYNLQKPSRAFQIGERHYDLGDDLYSRMLGKRMMYGPGQWEDGLTLDEAQDKKLETVCRKLDLQPGMRMLDIGCGWGGAAQFAAERYGVHVVGITVSKEQVQHARERCKGLPVEVRLLDYRQIEGKYDRILSLGMFEHVGYKNHRRYMDVVKRSLKKDGRFLLHTIGGNRTVRQSDPWIEAYIFPNSLIPSATQICRSAEGRFVLEDWQNAGPDYDKTLMHWFWNFDEAWPSLRSTYDERFYRMWTYYLLSCAGMFRARKNQLWQVLYSANGIPGGFRRDRAEEGQVALSEAHSLPHNAGIGVPLSRES